MIVTERKNGSAEVMKCRLHNRGRQVQRKAVSWKKKKKLDRDRSLVCLVEEPLNVSLNVAGEELPAVALERNSIWPDEELLKVPGHVVPADWAPDEAFGVTH